MDSVNFLSRLHEEIAHRRQEAYRILSYNYNDEQIKELCHLFNSKHPAQVYKELDEKTFFPTAALVLLMSIEATLPPPRKGYLLKNEDMAKLVLDALHAGACLIEAGWKPSEIYAVKGKKFTDGPKSHRLDCLGKTMLKVMEEKFSENGKYPPARELWNSIPVNKHIQEKELLTGSNDDRDKVIWWTTPDGREKKTTFGSFQARLTNLKKKLKKTKY